MITAGVTLILLIFITAIIRVAAENWKWPAAVVQILYLLLGLAAVVAILHAFGIEVPYWVWR